MFQRLLFPNLIYLANIVANAMGVLSVEFLVHRNPLGGLETQYKVLTPFRNLIILTAFLVITIANLIYELPIRNVIASLKKDEFISQSLLEKSRKRLLNEPFMLNLLNVTAWGIILVVYFLLGLYHGLEKKVLYRCFFGHLFTGLITSMFAFFLCERVIQKYFTPVFFPDGGLWKVLGVYKMNIRLRMIILLFCINIIPLLVVVAAIFQIKLFDGITGIHAVFLDNIIMNSLIFIMVGLIITWLVSNNFTSQLLEIVEVLSNIKIGKMDAKVTVKTNDEIGYVGDSINEMVKGLIEREVVKELFGKYVSKEIRDKILKGSISFDGEIVEATVLFCDLRNFTGLVHNLGPKKAVKIINSYFQEMEEVISGNLGVVIQYIGDEIEAVFGVPISANDHHNRAVRSAILMCQRLGALNEKMGVNLDHVIGIHSGPALAANIGSPRRLSYALVGDTVNIAARIEDLAKELGYKLIISRETYEHLEMKELFKPIGSRVLKGIDGVYELFALKPETFTIISSMPS